MKDKMQLPAEYIEVHKNKIRANTKKFVKFQILTISNLKCYKSGVLVYIIDAVNITFM